jgi:hypothetical protein
MAVINKIELGRELFRTVAAINIQIEEIKNHSKSMGIKPEEMRDAYGGWVLVPLIAAKAQCLNALAIINQRD